MKPFAIILFFAITLRGFGQSVAFPIDTVNVYSIDVYDAKGVWKDAQKVSVKDIIQHPKKYHHKLVSVYGYIALSPKGGSNLFSSKESFTNQNYSDAILCAQNREDVFVQMKKFKEGYAILTGLFLFGEDNNKDKYVICNIRRIDISK